MNSWAPLWSGLVDSSVWEEPDHVFRVFMAMMSLKDASHIVSLSGYTLAKRIHMPLEKVLDAEKILAAPDTRRPGQEFDGRRIEPVDGGGWLVLKGEFYRKLVREEMRRARNRKSQQAYRDRKKASSSGTPLPGERAYVDAVNRGDEAEAQRIVDGMGAPERQEQKSAATFPPSSAPPDNGDIPEIPTRDQYLSSTGQPPGGGPFITEPSSGQPGDPPPLGSDPTESGEWVDGVWVPD